MDRLKYCLWTKPGTAPGQSWHSVRANFGLTSQTNEYLMGKECLRFSSGSPGTKLRPGSVGAETLRPSRGPQLRGAACRPSLGLAGGPSSREQRASSDVGLQAVRRLQGKGSAVVSSAHIAPDLLPAPSHPPPGEAPGSFHFPTSETLGFRPPDAL